MKKLIVAALVVVAGLSAQAGGFHYYHAHGWGFRPAYSFCYAGYPWYSPWYAYSPAYYPAYGYDYYPGYSYGYAGTRPNYAVNGTLLGALTGGIIGNSIHHQGWEGAGIGAAAGLLLGSVAEHNARANEQSYYAPPAISYAAPSRVANAPTVNDAPMAPAAPRMEDSGGASYRPAGNSSMSGANSLFGR